MLLPYLKVTKHAAKSFNPNDFTGLDDETFLYTDYVEEDRDGNQYYQINHSTSLQDIVDMLNDPKLPRGVKMIWVDER